MRNPYKELELDPENEDIPQNHESDPENKDIPQIRVDSKEKDIPQNPVHLQNIAVVGAEKVGKTKLVHSLIRIDDFNKEYRPTVGATEVILKENNVVLSFQDCSGAAKYQRFIPLYLRKADQVLLTYDVNQHETLEALIPYIEMVKKSERAEDTKLILVGILKNRDSDPVVTQEAAAAFAGKHDLNACFQVFSYEPGGSDELRQHLIQPATLDYTPDEEDFLERKKIVDEQLRIFKQSAENEPKEAVKKSMLIIAAHLEKGLELNNANHFFYNIEEVLQEELRTLQYTDTSLYTSALNLILLTFACCTIIGMPALWLSGVLEKNAKDKGNPLLFADKGQKQQTEIIIAKTVNLFKKS